MRIIFCKFEDGHQTEFDAPSDEQAVAFVRRLAALYDGNVRVTCPLTATPIADNDRWLTPEDWLARQGS